MALKKFFTKVLIVLSVVAVVFLAACASASPAPAVSLLSTDPEYIRIYNLGFADGKSSVMVDQTACQGFINQTTCQSFVDTALVSAADSCSMQIDQAQATWQQGLSASCQQEGYKTVDHDVALSLLEDEGYRCYIPVILVFPTPKPEKPEKPEKPVEPPCVTCPVPPVEPPCASCPVPPGD